MFQFLFLSFLIVYVLITVNILRYTRHSTGTIIYALTISGLGAGPHWFMVQCASAMRAPPTYTSKLKMFLNISRD